MSGHELWHVVLLGSSLAALAGVIMVVLAPLLFEELPAGLARARPAVFGLALVAGLLFAWEWLFVH